MERVKDIYKSFIMMFSEIIWIYYAIVMFTSIEWDQPVFFDLTWLVVSGVMGYILNALLAKRNNHALLFAGNLLVIGLIIVQNWRNVVPEGAWVFGLWLSIGLSFIFIRSARLVHQKPTRPEILHRFEANVILYIIFALVFTVRDWSNETFHLSFIFAIVSSLTGMILTLHNHADAEGGQKIQVMKVGQSGWFAGVATALLVSIPLFSLILLLPAVNRTLYSLGMGVWEGLKWLALKIVSFLVWLAGLLPEPEKTGENRHSVPEQPTIPPGAGEETFVSFPYVWIMAGIAILLIVIAIWVVSKLIKNRQITRSMLPKHIMVTKESWWANFKRNLNSYFKCLKLRWRMRFPYYYYQPIYWYYHQVLRWGKKNGFPKEKWETSREYVQRIIDHIPAGENSLSCKGQNYRLPELLKRLNRDYQATYYGPKAQISGATEYKLLIKLLRSTHLN